MSGAGRMLPGIHTSFDAILNHMIHGGYSVCHIARQLLSVFCGGIQWGRLPCDFHGKGKLGNIMEDSWADLQASVSYREFGRKS